MKPKQGKKKTKGVTPGDKRNSIHVHFRRGRREQKKEGGLGLKTEKELNAKHPGMYKALRRGRRKKGLNLPHIKPLPPVLIASPDVPQRNNSWKKAGVASDCGRRVWEPSRVKERRATREKNG